MSTPHRFVVGLFLLLALSVPTPSAATPSLLGDQIDFTYLANGALFAPPPWPGHAFNVTVVDGGWPEYDYFGLGRIFIDVGANYIHFFTSSVGWANFPPGFTGIEISGLDWSGIPGGGHIQSINVSIPNPHLVNQGQGAPVPYSANLVTFGSDWVRIPTGGYNMDGGFEIFVTLQPAQVPELTTMSFLLLGAGTLGVRRLVQRGTRKRHV